MKNHEKADNMYCTGRDLQPRAGYRHQSRPVGMFMR